MKRDKTRGYLPVECVNHILSIYKEQNKERNQLLNHIEYVGYLKSIHMKEKCDHCRKNFIKCTDEEFIKIILNVAKFNKENQAITTNFFPSLSDITPYIGDTMVHDLVWKERFQCRNCNYLLCFKCRIDAEYPLRFIDIWTQEQANNDTSIVCPLCKEITQVNHYLRILRKQELESKNI